MCSVCYEIQVCSILSGNDMRKRPAVVPPSFHRNQWLDVGGTAKDTWNGYDQDAEISLPIHEHSTESK
jgi:hypothetical protein